MKALELNSVFEETKYNEQHGFGVQVFGEQSSFRGWNNEYSVTLDFILYKDIRCCQYGILSDCFKSGRPLSDHRPVFCCFILKNSPMQQDQSKVRSTQVEEGE